MRKGDSFTEDKFSKKTGEGGEERKKKERSYFLDEKK